MADPVAPAQISQDQETRKDADPKPQSSKFWLGEISASQKREERWYKRAKAVVDRFRDVRDRTGDSERRTNILWSNTEILKAALFNGLGNPDVRRRFPKKGQDDRAARTAAIVLERGLSYCQEAYDADAAVECAVEDMLLPGRGQAWIVYEADVESAEVETKEREEDALEQKPGEMDDDDAGPVPAMSIEDQRAELHHVYWQDFLTSPGRKWKDVWWVARRHVYSKDELTETFGEEHANAVPMGAQIDTGSDEKSDTFKRANVWEIWDKSKKQRVYVAEGYEQVLKSDEDPYRLQGFFPCPEPLYGVKTTSSLEPIPEYTLYQDQAMELDAITTRLQFLVDALRRRGVYDASEEGPDNKLSQLMLAKDNQFVPYKGFAALMEKGGLRGVFQAEDIAPISAVIDRLTVHRATIIQSIYEVTGISDVLRGSSNPNETATAQRIKGQFGSLRLQKRQARVQRFIRDCYRLKAEIIAEHFTREKLVEMTGIDMPDEMEIARAQQIMSQAQMAQQIQQAPPGQAPGMQAPMPMSAPVPMPPPAVMKEAQATLKAAPWKAVSDILRSDDRRGYKIDIESDATARADDMEEKQARIEFMTSMEAMLGRIIPAARAEPAMLPLGRELISFGIRTFKVGRSLEEAFDDAFDQLQQSIQSAPQQGPPPDPVAEAKAEKLKAEAVAKQQQTQANMQKAGLDQQIRQQEAAADQIKTQAELEGKQIDNETKRAMAEMQAMLVQQKAQIADMQAQMKMGQAVAKAMQSVGVMQ